MAHRQRIKEAGLKVTLPRVKILRILEAQGQRHFSAEDVYRELLQENENIGLATVYRVLTQFESAALVCRHHFESGQSVFELNRGRHHDHLVCMRCGTVVEFVEETIERCQREIAARYGFQIEEHSLVMHGICPNCQARGRGQP